MLDHAPGPHAEEGPPPEADRLVPELFHQPTQLGNRQLALILGLRLAGSSLRVLVRHHCRGHPRQSPLLMPSVAESAVERAATRHSGSDLAVRCHGDPTRAWRGGASEAPPSAPAQRRADQREVTGLG